MSEKPEQYKAEAEINLIHECGLLKLTNRREFLALPMEQRRELLSEQVAIIRQALPQYCDSAYDGHSTMEPDQPKSPELLNDIWLIHITLGLNELEALRKVRDETKTRTVKDTLDRVQMNLMECSYHTSPFYCIPVANFQSLRQELGGK
jgi:hypothetical protein